jgi:hypothetical protein
VNQSSIGSCLAYAARRHCRTGLLSSTARGELFTPTPGREGTGRKVNFRLTLSWHRPFPSIQTPLRASSPSKGPSTAPSSRKAKARCWNTPCLDFSRPARQTSRKTQSSLVSSDCVLQCSLLLLDTRRYLFTSEFFIFFQPQIVRAADMIL